ncbi:MAG TPA: hypothetical protein DD791_11830 [Syntrophomonas sp.]|jgi:hypothetical protein|nr:hypothetical protein [Syntrophomonas sp.]
MSDIQIKKLYKSTVEMYSRVGEQGLVLATQSPMLFQFNNVSCEIWELIDGENSVEDIIEQISKRYPTTAPEVIKDDIVELFQALIDNELIVLQEDHHEKSTFSSGSITY